MTNICSPCVWSRIHSYSHTHHWPNKFLPSRLSGNVETWQAHDSLIHFSSRPNLPDACSSAANPSHVNMNHLSVCVCQTQVRLSQNSRHSSDSRLHKDLCSFKESRTRELWFVLFPAVFMACLPIIHVGNSQHLIACQENLGFQFWWFYLQSWLTGNAWQ